MFGNTASHLKHTRSLTVPVAKLLATALFLMWRRV